MMPKIVINIDDDLYNVIQSYDQAGIIACAYQLSQIIKSGTSLNDIKAEIPILSHWQTDDGQDLLMVADVLECIDKHTGKRQSE